MDEPNVFQALIATEQALLGGAMLDVELYDKLASKLFQRDFFIDAHRKVFVGIKDELEDRGSIAPLLLARRLEQNGVKEAFSLVTSIREKACDQDSFISHLEVVLDAAKERNISGLGQKVKDDTNNASAWAEKIQAEKERCVDDSDEFDATSVLTRWIDRQQVLINNDGELIGLATPIIELNKLTLGLQKTDMIVVAARPSMGKTGFAVNMAVHCAVESNLPAIIFSLEMSEMPVMDRVMAMLSHVPVNTLKTPRLMTDEQWNKQSTAMGKLNEAPFYLIDNPRFANVDLMRKRAKDIKRKHGGQLGLIVIDYLQLMNDGQKHQSREREVAELSKAVKRMAKDLDVPVVVLSQLSRNVEGRTDKRPLMSDLRESGGIEQDADVILMLYRDEYYDKESASKGIAEIIIGKQRNGATDTVLAAFMPEIQLFGNLGIDHRERDVTPPRAAFVPKTVSLSGKKVWSAK